MSFERQEAAGHTDDRCDDRGRCDAGAPTRLDRALGFALVALLPALFWVVVLRGLAVLAGQEADGVVLAAAGLSIAVFLGFVRRLLHAATVLHD